MGLRAHSYGYSVTLNGSLPKVTAPGTSPICVAEDAGPSGTVDMRRPSVLLAIMFAITLFISTAMAAHLPRSLMAAGATLATAVAIGALVGPTQVAGRLLEFGFLRKIHPLLSARLASLMHPLGACVLVLFGAPVAAIFALMHGAGNGIPTIAVGTLPRMIFGSKGYGQRQGLLMVPARVLQALAPWLFGVFLDRWGTGALWLSAVLGVVAFGSLLLLQAPATVSMKSSANAESMRKLPRRKKRNLRQY